MRTLTIKDDRSSLDVSLNEEIRLELPENPTTGYGWELQHDASLTLVSADYVPGTAVGAGGARQFILRMEKPGESTLRAIHKRGWNGEESITARLAIVIRAK